MRRLLSCLLLPPTMLLMGCGGSLQPSARGQPAVEDQSAKSERSDATAKAAEQVAPKEPAKEAAAKRSVPDEKTLADAESKMRTVFDESLKGAQTPAQKQALARQLISTASESGDDGAAVYILLRTAGNLATNAGDVELAWQSWDLLGRQFNVDTIELSSDSLMKVTQSATQPSQQPALLKKHEELLEKCVAAEKFELVDAIAANAEKIAAVADNAQAMWAWKRHREDVATLLAAFAAASRAKSTLAESPDNAKANAELGRYLCFVKTHWEKGLAHLAKGDDETLRSLAEREVKPSGDKMVNVALGDGWRAFAEKLSGRMKRNCLDHAGTHYSTAVSNLTGLDKALAQKRLAGVLAGATIDEGTSRQEPAIPSAPERREPYAARFSEQDYVEVRNSAGMLNLNRDFTIELWARWPANSKAEFLAGDEAWPEMSKQLVIDAECGWVIRYGDFFGKPSLDFNVGVKDRRKWLSTNAPVRLSDHWHHVAACRRDGIISLYLDGVPIAETSVDGVTLVPSPTLTYLGCRKNCHVDRKFNGEIAKFRMSSMARYRDAFKPEKEWEDDDQTLVLFNVEKPVRPGFLEDASGNNRMGVLSPGVNLIPIGE